MFYTDATQVFSLASDKTLSVDASPITCDFYIKDPYVEAGPFTYELTVTDVNEAPVCDGLMYYGTLTEEMAVSPTLLYVTSSAKRDLITAETVSS